MSDEFPAQRGGTEIKSLTAKDAKTTPSEVWVAPSDFDSQGIALECDGDMTSCVGCIPPLARFLRDLRVFLLSL
jgi:hypothetical protein